MRSSPSHPPTPGASEAGASPAGPGGTGPSSRGDNPAFVPFVQRPERGWASLLHKGISWWGLVPLSPLSAQGWGWRWEVGPAGVWRRPLSLPEGVGMAEGWGAGALLAPGSGGWSLWGEEQRVPQHGNRAPLAGPVLCPGYHGGALGADGASPKLLPGTLSSSRRVLAALAGERHRSGGNRCRLVAFLRGWRFLRVGERNWAAWVNPRYLWVGGKGCLSSPGPRSSPVTPGPCTPTAEPGKALEQTCERCSELLLRAAAVGAGWGHATNIC